MKRKSYIDYAKALCIITVVVIHAGISWLNNVAYILMTLFFFTSGYTAHYEKRTFGENVKHLFVKILIPFWIFMAIYGIWEVFRSKFLGYGDVSILLPAVVGLVYGTSYKTPLLAENHPKIVEVMSYKPANGTSFLDVMLPSNCHLWFLPALFTGTILFLLYLKLKKRNIYTDLISIVLLLLLASVETFPELLQLPYSLGRGFYACACMILGRRTRESNLLENDKLLKNPLKVGAIMLVLLGASVGFYLLGAGQSALVRSTYGSHGALAPLITFGGGICATLLMLFAFRLFPEDKELRGLSWIGGHTMPIYLWHMFFLNIISILLLKLTNLPLAEDIWFMAILPTNRVDLILLTAVLSIACCTFPTLVHKKEK